MTQNFGDLLASERAGLLAFFRRAGRARDAEDLYQQLAQGTLRRPPGAGVTDPRSWLYGAARRMAARTDSETLPLNDEIADKHDLHQDLERAEIQAAIARSLDSLDAPAREWLLRHHAQGVGLKELAADAGISHGAMAARLGRSRKQIVRNLDWTSARILAAYGVDSPEVASSYWCPKCGDAPLNAVVSGSEYRYAIRCPACGKDPLYLAEGRSAAGFQCEPNTSIELFLMQSRRNYRRWLRFGSFLCPLCGLANAALPTDFAGSLTSTCRACGTESVRSSFGFAICLRRTRVFWAEHRRIHIEQDTDEIRFISRKGHHLRIPLDHEFRMPI